MNKNRPTVGSLMTMFNDNDPQAIYIIIEYVADDKVVVYFLFNEQPFYNIWQVNSILNDEIVG